MASKNIDFSQMRHVIRYMYFLIFSYKPTYFFMGIILNYAEIRILYKGS